MSVTRMNELIKVLTDCYVLWVMGYGLNYSKGGGKGRYALFWEREREERGYLLFVEGKERGGGGKRCLRLMRLGQSHDSAPFFFLFLFSFPPPRHALPCLLM